MLSFLKMKKRYPKIIFIIIILLLRFFLIKTRFSKKESQNDFKELISYNYNDSGIPKFINGTFNDKKIYSSSDVIDALNEAYADIMGSLIEGKNWLIAENNHVDGLRDLSNPERLEFQSKKGEKYYYLNSYDIESFLKAKELKNVTDYDSGEVHINSTVVSHAAYLMYEVGAFESREQMAKVWYQSLYLLSSYSNFEDCALAVIKTAKTMNLSDDSITKITQAFIDTNML